MELTTTRKVLRIVALILLLLVLCAITFTTVFFLNIQDFAQLDMNKILGADQSTLIYDYKGEVIRTVYSGENRVWVDIEEIPREVQLAFVAAEDARFYQHSGVDVRRIFGALWADIKAGKLVQGASTITQQLIKNSHLTRTKTFVRKIEEALMAIKLEQAYDKDEILEMYLNYIYFGGGAYGIQAAAQRYFSKDARDLTVEEGASLAAAIKSPSNYAPHIEPENNKGRRDVILGLMEEYGFLDTQAAADAKAKPLVLQENEKTGQFGWYVDAALMEAASTLGMSFESLLTGGYRIYTEMDPVVQSAAEEAYKNPELFPENAADGTKVESAMVVMDPASGGVRAMIGGRDYSVQLGLNRATSVRRSPGSSIKPILVYLPALMSGRYTGASLFLDEPTDFNGYSPRNFGDKYEGTITLRHAVEQSSNVPAVTAMDALGVEYCKAFAQEAGIPFTSQDTGLSLALGGFSTGVSPLELCGAYAMMANDGVYTQPKVVTRIEDREGNVLYAAGSTSKRLIKSSVNFMMTDILRSTVEEGNCGRLALSNVPLAGKSGTHGHTVGNRDIWMASYNKEYAMVTWMGFDVTDEDHHLPGNVTGGTYPAQLSRAVYQGIYGEKAGPEFSVPEGVTRVSLDAASLMDGILKLATDTGENAVSEYFETASLATLLSNQGGPGESGAVSGFDVTTDDATKKPIISFSTNEAALRYQLMRRAEGASSYEVVKEFSHSGSPIVYVDSSAQDGIGYTYYLAAVDSAAPQEPVYETSKIFFLPAAAPSWTPPDWEATPSPSLEPSPTPAESPAA